VFETFLILL